MSRVVGRSTQSTVIFFLVLLVYGSIAGGRYLFDRPEAFPFAPFALYSHANETNTDYAVRVTAVGDLTLQPARYFQEAPDLFPLSRDVTAQATMNRMGAALATGDLDEAAEARETLESIYLNLDRHQRITYEIVERTFVALERWETGEFLDETPLASYEVDVTDAGGS